MRTTYKKGAIENPVRLDLFCKSNDVPYPVHTSNPTTFECAIGEDNMLVKYFPRKEWCIVSERDLSVIEVLRLLAWRAHCWDAREVWSRYRKSLPFGGMEQKDEIF